MVQEYCLPSRTSFNHNIYYVRNMYNHILIEYYSERIKSGIIKNYVRIKIKLIKKIRIIKSKELIIPQNWNFPFLILSHLIKIP